jgi:hypothetical protein
MAEGQKIKPNFPPDDDVKKSSDPGYSVIRNAGKQDEEVIPGIPASPYSSEPVTRIEGSTDAGMQGVLDDLAKREESTSATSLDAWRDASAHEEALANPAPSVEAPTLAETQAELRQAVGAYSALMGVSPSIATREAERGPSVKPKEPPPKDAIRGPLDSFIPEKLPDSRDLNQVDAITNLAEFRKRKADHDEEVERNKPRYTEEEVASAIADGVRVGPKIYDHRAWAGDRTITNESKEQGTRFGKLWNWTKERGPQLTDYLKSVPGMVKKDIKGAYNFLSSPEAMKQADKAVAERFAKYAGYFFDGKLEFDRKLKKLGQDAIALSESYRKMPFHQKVYLSSVLLAGSAVAGGAGLLFGAITGAKGLQRGLAALGTGTLVNAVAEKNLQEREAETGIARTRFDTWKKHGLAVGAASLIALGVPGHALHDLFIGSEHGVEWLAKAMEAGPAAGTGPAVSLDIAPLASAPVGAPPGIPLDASTYGPAAAIPSEIGIDHAPPAPNVFEQHAMPIDRFDTDSAYRPQGITSAPAIENAPPSAGVRIVNSTGGSTIPAEAPAPITPTARPDFVPTEHHGTVHHELHHHTQHAGGLSAEMREKLETEYLYQWHAAHPDAGDAQVPQSEIEAYIAEHTPHAAAETVAPSAPSGAEEHITRLNAHRAKLNLRPLINPEAPVQPVAPAAPVETNVAPAPTPVPQAPEVAPASAPASVETNIPLTEVPQAPASAPLTSEPAAPEAPVFPQGNADTASLQASEAARLQAGIPAGQWDYAAGHPNASYHLESANAVPTPEPAAPPTESPVQPQASVAPQPETSAAHIGEVVTAAPVESVSGVDYALAHPNEPHIYGDVDGKRITLWGGTSDQQMEWLDDHKMQHRGTTVDAASFDGKYTVRYSIDKSGQLVPIADAPRSIGFLEWLGIKPRNPIPAPNPANTPDAFKTVIQ